MADMRKLSTMYIVLRSSNRVNNITHLFMLCFYWYDIPHLVMPYFY